MQGHATLEAQLTLEQGLGVQIPPPNYWWWASSSSPLRPTRSRVVPTPPAATQAATRHNK